MKKSKKIILFFLIVSVISIALTSNTIISKAKNEEGIKKENKEETSLIEEEVEEESEEVVEATIEPVLETTIEPVIEVTDEFVVEPSVEPTIEPTITPTITPTVEPTAIPTIEPTIVPTIEPEEAAEEIEEKTADIIVREIEEKKPEISSILYDIQSGDVIFNETGYSIGNMNGKDIYASKENYSCYLDNDINFSGIDISYMNQVDQEEWDKYSYEMKVCYLNQVKNASLQILGVHANCEFKVVSNDEMMSFVNVPGHITVGLYYHETIRINRNCINEVNIIHALLHETRHCWQYNKCRDYEKVVLSYGMEYNEKEKCAALYNAYFLLPEGTNLHEEDAEKYADMMVKIWVKK